MKSRPNILPRHRRPLRQANRYVLPVFLLCAAALIMQIVWVQTHQEELSRQSPLFKADPDLFQRLFRSTITHVECRHCAKSGWIYDDLTGERRVCPVCHGLGYNPIRRLYDDDQLCPGCAGHGRIMEEDGRARDCQRCDGRGFVREFTR